MCWEGLQRLGFRRQRYTRVKSVSEAAAGADLTDEAVKARQASAGSFVEAEKRVHGDARTLYVRGAALTHDSHATHATHMRVSSLAFTPVPHRAAWVASSASRSSPTG